MNDINIWQGRKSYILKEHIIYMLLEQNYFINNILYLYLGKSITYKYHLSKYEILAIIRIYETK